ncbi:hypothetical protein BJ138DRAFT_1184070 [Hygrophoropsis aurantiaca]|uniref:Uncharacterized protein n=1 Tax=Hygrophoropsis aurantiaca TaxID=72124 RepID=A0ACB7ZUG0_9AGAM|nr:hypothetical protein BJ138DRAFT_1184070 [Hygrophoropsis aurantiaca]
MRERDECSAGGDAPVNAGSGNGDAGAAVSVAVITGTGAAAGVGGHTDMGVVERARVGVGDTKKVGAGVSASVAVDVDVRACMGIRTRVWVSGCERAWMGVDAACLMVLGVARGAGGDTGAGVGVIVWVDWDVSGVCLGRLRMWVFRLRCNWVVWGVYGCLLYRLRRIHTHELRNAGTCLGPANLECRLNYALRKTVSVLHFVVVVSVIAVYVAGVGITDVVLDIARASLTRTLCPSAYATSLQKDIRKEGKGTCRAVVLSFLANNGLQHCYQVLQDFEAHFRWWV